MYAVAYVLCKIWCVVVNTELVIFGGVSAWGIPASVESQVQQGFAVVDMADTVAAVYNLIADEMAEHPDHKIICFLPTARQTQFFSEMLNAAGIASLEIHSRKSQSYRTKISDQFRNAQNAVLLSSDVSARGVDYPDITLVVQVPARPYARQSGLGSLGGEAWGTHSGRL